MRRWQASAVRFPEPRLMTRCTTARWKFRGLLALRGQHRLPIPDLIIAACTERAGLTVLHYDADFERIAGVTHQPHEWVVQRGTV